MHRYQTHCAPSGPTSQKSQVTEPSPTECSPFYTQRSNGGLPVASWSETSILLRCELFKIQALIRGRVTNFSRVHNFSHCFGLSSAALVLTCIV